MAKTHNGVWGFGAQNEITVTDPEPLVSARLFKCVSDAIWERRPGKLRSPVWDVGSDMPMSTVDQVVNLTVGNIDTRLKIAGRQRGLTLPGLRNVHAIVPATKLRELSAASVMTTNWDAPERIIDIDGKPRYVTFTDGHMDYDRQLELRLQFDFPPSYLMVSYAMRRCEDSQDCPTNLHLGAYYSDLAEVEYNGSALHSAPLTPEQETTMIKMFALIGGISIEHFEE